MRLSVLDNGHSWKQIVPFSVMKVLMGRVPGPVLLFAYRRKFFGDHFTSTLQEAMRGASHWSKGEVELFAAFVSHLNQCAY